MKKRLLLSAALLAAGIYFGFDTALYHLNDRFAISNISSREVFFSKESQTPSITPLLDQPYAYLGQGSQCYVFVSEDDKYEIKFFKHQRSRLHPSFAWIAPNKDAAKKKKWRGLQTSCALANEKLSNESGLLYLHLTKTDIFKKRLGISDKLKRLYEVNLDDHEWILQKKGKLLYPTLIA